MEHEEGDQAKQNIQAVKPELEKNTRISLKNIFLKDRRHKNCRSASRK